MAIVTSRQRKADRLQRRWGILGKPVTGRSAAVVLLGLAALWLTLGVTVAGVVPKSMAGRTLGVFLFDARAGAASAVTVTADRKSE
jgi:hypothetical protein